jgi:hypothetical protein
MRGLALNAVIESLLLLSSELVLVDNLELRTKGRILGHVLDQNSQLRDGLFVEILFLINLGQEDNNELKSFVALSKKSNRVLLKEVCQQLVHNLRLIYIILERKK